MIEPVEEEAPKRKNLKFWSKYTPQERQRFMTSEQKHQTILKELVGSKFWSALKLEMTHIASQYATTPPAKLNLLIGYMTYSIIRDGFNQLIDNIEREALKAPDPTAYDG